MWKTLSGKSPVRDTIHSTNTLFALQIITTMHATDGTPATASEFPDLAGFFAPRRVALLGATDDLSKFGGRCMKQLIDFGFPGEIYPINPKRQQVMGVACHPSLADTPHPPDHVGIVLPAHAVASAVDDCIARGVRFATVFSAGFGEQGTPEALQAQNALVERARAGGLRLMGPNCNGLVNFVDQFALTSTASINGPRAPAGDIGIVGQSGGAGQVNVMWRAIEMGLGISYQVSCGNAADLDLMDYASFMLESESTRVVLMLAERLADGRKLRALSHRAAQLRKPLVMVKAGRTEMGAKAAASHTGAVTGADAVFDKVLEQLGILRVDDYPDLYQCAMLLRRQRWTRSAQVSATSISGGNLVLLADMGAGQGLQWPEFSDTTQAQLQNQLPGFGTATNPADLTAAAIGQKGAFAQAAKTILEDPAIDLMMPVLTIASADEVRSVAQLSEQSDKAVAIIWTGRASDDATITPRSLVQQGHAVYRDAGPCVRAVSALQRFSAFLHTYAERVPQRPAGLDRSRALSLLPEQPGLLSEWQAKQVLGCYGLRPTREHLATDIAEAQACARQIGAPVAMKIQSPDIPHKTEAKALKLRVQGDAQVAQAYAEVLANAQAYKPDAKIEGVLVQEMVEDAQEMLIGMSHDPTWGPIITVGLGGVWVEVLKDVTFLLAPSHPDHIRTALAGLRGYGMLQEVRGRPARDLEALVDFIERFSWLAADLEPRIEELDVNPLAVRAQGQGVAMVDALMLLGAPKA